MAVFWHRDPLDEFVAVEGEMLEGLGGRALFEGRTLRECPRYALFFLCEYPALVGGPVLAADLRGPVSRVSMSEAPIL